jgi:DNA-3-methyladenine glycosylase
MASRLHSSAVTPLTVPTSLADLPPLQRGFYDRDPRRVARDLLGKVLLRRQGRTVLAGRIVEVEAYLGDDPAAHSFAGRTARNAVLWGPPGISYVYFIYGNHYCFNVSCLPDGVPGGVLFRALEPLAGMRVMAVGRGGSLEGFPDLRALTSGPGRLAEAFGITRARDNGKDLTSCASDLWIANDGSPRPGVKITARIGITKAAERPLRYVVVGNRFVSGPRTAANAEALNREVGKGIAKGAKTSPSF